MSSFSGRAPRRAPHSFLNVCPQSAESGEKRVQFKPCRTSIEVDAVLPADLDGAPRARRKHTRGRRSFAQHQAGNLSGLKMDGSPYPREEPLSSYC